MASIENALEDIERLLEDFRAQDAEERTRALLLTMGQDELQLWEFDIRETLSRFYKKRQKKLTAFFECRLKESVTVKHVINNSEENSIKYDFEILNNDFINALLDLSNQHIFQWSTFYRDSLSYYFDYFLEASGHGVTIDDIVQIIHQSVLDHTKDIFKKGFNFIGGELGISQKYAINKSISGLQRFLELPVEFYSAKNIAGQSIDMARKVRSITSAFLSGILQGYASLRLGNQIGSQILPRYPRSWAHYLVFITGYDLKALLDDIEPGEFRDGVYLSLLPFVEAIDSILDDQNDYAPLPALGQLEWGPRRFDASLIPPVEGGSGGYIEVMAFLDASFVSLPLLQEALNRDVSLIISPLKVDLQSILSRNPKADQIIVLASPDIDSPDQVKRRIIEILNYAIYRRRSVRAGSAPLTYNFAREFPIQNPYLTKYFHVYRSSVRELLRTFERRSGVRLWCSVRRSGKTTACFDLSTPTGTSVIISQTCGSAQFPDATLMYDEFSEAIEDGRQLARGYFSDLVARCATNRRDSGERYVLIIDEYETLFGRLKTSAMRDPGLRYTVVQPLLNQMVEFASNNLLVFIGQQPNAHFILMDQNQLSPYVEQDPFPLFHHTLGSLNSEFSKLLRKVLTERLEFNGNFADTVFKETSGHPFLTVKILVALVDWLIEEKRPLKELNLSDADFSEFSNKKLAPREVSLSPEYVFFREAISEAIGSYGRKADPWLYSVYSVINKIVASHPKKLACSPSEFSKIVNQLNIEQFGLSSDRLLSTGIQANFFELQGADIGPKIPLLGRIAGICHGNLAA